MIELTLDQHSSVVADPENPKRVRDPISKEVFVLLPEQTYDQVCRRLFEDRASEIDVGQLIHEAMEEYDSDDPLLASYQSARDN